MVNVIHSVVFGVRTLRTGLFGSDSGSYKNSQTTHLIYGLLFLQISQALISDGTLRRKDVGWGKTERREEE